MNNFTSKLFKYAYGANIILILATAFGYLALFPGVVLHVSLGVIQIALFLVALFHFKKYTKAIRIQLLVYGIICTSVLLYYTFESGKLGFQTMVISSVPLAIFFTVILKQLKSFYHGFAKQ